MVQHVSIEEATQRLRELIQAAASGDTIVIDESANLQIRLVPVRPPMGRLRYGSMRGQIHMADDFDAPLEDFAEYM